jgi:hypothetical protein
MEYALMAALVDVAGSKNYQLWHHRRVLTEWTGVPEADEAFTASTLENDPKHYHAWSHRQWLTRRFGGFEREVEISLQYLQRDIRNNSAWNHRWFALTFAPPPDGERGGGVEDDDDDEEDGVRGEPGQHTGQVIDENASVGGAVSRVLRRRETLFAIATTLREDDERDPTAMALPRIASQRVSHSHDLLVSLRVPQHDGEGGMEEGKGRHHGGLWWMRALPASAPRSGVLGNESALNFLRGLIRASPTTPSSEYPELWAWMAVMASSPRGRGSVAFRAFLVDALEEEGTRGSLIDATIVANALAEDDPVRTAYWNMRADRAEAQAVALGASRLSAGSIRELQRADQDALAAVLVEAMRVE